MNPVTYLGHGYALCVAPSFVSVGYRPLDSISHAEYAFWHCGIVSEIKYISRGKITSTCSIRTIIISNVCKQLTMALH